MTDRLKYELEDIRRRFGLEPDAEDIIKLYEACKRCDAPYRTTNLSLLEMPVVVGNISLWPLTIGASIWLDEFALQWWKRSDLLMFWALVYAFVHGRDKDAFLPLTNETTAYQRIRETMLRFACTREELNQAVDRLTGRGDQVETLSDEEARADPDWSSFVSELEIQSGISADQWLWGKSVAYTARAYTEHRRLLAAQAGRESSITDALDEALTNLAKVKKAIWLKHQKGAAK